MASPFPGMGPYLEDPAHGPDFHATFINYCRETLTGLLPARYTARPSREPLRNLCKPEKQDEEQRAEIVYQTAPLTLIVR
jgi:hypothetical protein